MKKGSSIKDTNWPKPWIKRSNCSPPLLGATLTGPTLSSLQKQWSIARRLADFIELRLDLIEDRALHLFRDSLKNSPLPLLLTHRTQKEEAFLGDKRKLYCRFLYWIFYLHPRWIDCEWPQDRELAHKLLKMGFSACQLLFSQHLYENTASSLYPNNLKNGEFDQEAPWNFCPERVTIAERQGTSEGENLKVQPTPSKTNFSSCLGIPIEKTGPFRYKSAVYLKDSIETLQWLNRLKFGERVSVIGMGEEAAWTRPFLPYLFPCSMTFAAPLKESISAKGQYTLEEMRQIYRFGSLKKPLLFTLIGDPITQSVGHLFHNLWLKEKQIDGLYVKIRVQKERLADFFAYASSLPFKGFSVTMPLKEAVLPFLNSLSIEAAAIKAVNTIEITSSGWKGYNFDGQGALNALEKRGKITGKTILLIGAGATARAIAFEAYRRGAKKILFFSRRPSLESNGRLLSELPQALESEGDILIHATPVGMHPNVKECLVETSCLRKSLLVMDVVAHPQKTLLLQRAAACGLDTVDGSEMFLQQAALQADLWHNTDNPTGS